MKLTQEQWDILVGVFGDIELYVQNDEGMNTRQTNKYLRDTTTLWKALQPLRPEPKHKYDCDHIRIVDGVCRDCGEVQ